MNAFDYSIAISIVVQKPSRLATICYRIDIADEYVWYGDLGGFDQRMAHYEETGVGRGYEIRGSSMIRCESFDESVFVPDTRFGSRFSSYGLVGY
jgi:hypothetical protein